MVHSDVDLNESAEGLRMAIVVSRYHDAVTSQMERAAVETFIADGGAAENLRVYHTPGTFELPVLCGELARTKPSGRAIDAIVAIGCVITGQTSHDRYINTAVSNALAQLSATTGVPITFGVLTCATMQQAADRAGGAKGNKGVEAMRAAIAAARAVKCIRRAGEKS